VDNGRSSVKGAAGSLCKRLSYQDVVRLVAVDEGSAAMAVEVLAMADK